MNAKVEGHHHHHVHEIKSLDHVIILGIALNLLFVFVEAGVGFGYNSLGLLSDAGHNLSDVFSLLLVLVAFRLNKIHGSAHYTYGFKKSTILISLLNAIILLVAVGAIIAESIHKFSYPEPVNGAAVSWTAGVGILINGITAWTLMSHQKADLNVRGAFLHMATDTLVSVGVVISGIIISLTGFMMIDSIVSLVIAVVILISTWNLLSSSLRLSVDGVPDNVDMKQVQAILAECPHVIGMHHLHVWAMSTTENALTAHIVLSDLNSLEEVKKQLKTNLDSVGITHSTLEFELKDENCRDCTCD